MTSSESFLQFKHNNPQKFPEILRERLKVLQEKQNEVALSIK